MPVGSVLQKPATVHLRVGAPISNSDLESDVRRDETARTDREIRQILMSRYMERINGLLDPEYRYVAAPAPQPGNAPY